MVEEPAPRPMPPTLLGGPLPGEEDRPRPAPPSAPVSRRGRTRHARLSSGRVMARAFRILLRNLAPSLFLAVLVYVPYFAVQYVVMGNGARGTVAWWPIVLFGVLAFTLPYVLQGALAYGTYRAMRDDPARFLDGVATGLKRLGAVLGVALLLLLILGTPVAVGTALLLGGLSRGVGLLALLLGYVVTIILQCVYYVAVPVAVVEGAGPGRALARSAALTKGARWTVFAILFVLGILAWGAGQIVDIALGPGRGSVGYPVAALIASGLVVVFFAAWQSICAAVAYHDVRRAKEGVGIEELVKVFE